MTDPVSWLQIEQGWSVAASDGTVVGTVAQVAGDKQSDIFDGLAVASESPKQVRYVPAEVVGTIIPGEVHLTITGTESAGLAPYEAAAPETTFRADQPEPITSRISRWLGIKR
jgi:hypothetical protein